MQVESGKAILGLKLDQIEEEEFADRSSLDSDGAGGRGVVGRQPPVMKQVIFKSKKHHYYHKKISRYQMGVGGIR